MAAGKSGQGHVTVAGVTVLRAVVRIGMSGLTMWKERECDEQLLYAKLSESSLSHK